MKKALLIIMLAIMLFPACCRAEKSAVLVIVDGMGSSYIYPEHAPTCIDGTPLPVTGLNIVKNATARYDLWVPTPETESGNAVIATGYSGATEEMVSYYGATIYDALRAGGYLSMAIMETGDTGYMIAKPDIIVYEKNNSIYNPMAAIVVNNKSIPVGVEEILASNSPVCQATNTDPVIAYRQYDSWSLARAVAMVRFLGATYPDLKYLLVVNAAGTDMAAHEHGFDNYRQAIADLDPELTALADACKETGSVLLVTADHGMSFKSSDSKGSHATGAASERNESRLAPLIVIAGEPGSRSGLYGQECLAPTLLALMGCQDSLSVEDGKPIPVSGSPSPAAKIADQGGNALPAASWQPYTPVAALAALGLIVALRLLKRR